MARVLGHKKIIKVFKKMADEGRLAHGYIFFGPEGVGKFLVARGLASYLENKDFEARDLVLNDTMVISPGEKSSIGIDKIRAIWNFIYQRPNVSLYRLVIINDADKLTAEAQNSLLKIAEEPPKAGLLILVVSDFEFLKKTLVSRLSKIYFSAIPISDVRDWLIEEHKIKAGKAGILADSSFGKPGLALKTEKDDKFRITLKKAAEFLSLRRRGGGNFLKDLTRDESFNFEDFLDAVIINLAPRAKEDSRFWHQVLDLKKNAYYFNLNPRVQLEALLN